MFGSLFFTCVDQRWWVQYYCLVLNTSWYFRFLSFGCVLCLKRISKKYQNCIFYWGRHTIKKSLISKKKLRTSFAFVWGSASDFRKCLDTGDPWHLEEQLPRKSLRGKLAGKSTIGWRCTVFPIRNGALLQFFMLVFRGIRSWNSWNFETKASWKLEQLQVYQLSLGFCQLFFLAGSVGNLQLFKGGVTFLETIWPSTISENDFWLKFGYHFDRLFFGKRKHKNKTKRLSPLVASRKGSGKALLLRFFNMKIGGSCCRNCGLQ